MTLEQLKTKATFWCDLLGVEDRWSVTLSIGNVSNMEGNVGLNELEPEYQKSHIILAPGESDDTLVHEILHILLDGYKSRKEISEDRPQHELAINKIAAALVALATKKKKNVKQSTAKGTATPVPSKGRKQPRKKCHTATSPGSPAPVRVSKHAVSTGNSVCSGGVRN